MNVTLQQLVAEHGEANVIALVRLGQRYLRMRQRQLASAKLRRALQRQALAFAMKHGFKFDSSASNE